MSFGECLNFAIQTRLNTLRNLDITDERGKFLGSRIFTKNKSVVVARCMLCAAGGGIGREIDISQLNVRDLSHARDPSGLIGETELVCTEEYFDAFISILEASGFVRRVF